MNFVYKAEAFTQEELDYEYKEVITTFYKRVKILLHYQNMALSNPTHIKRLLLFFLGFMKKKLRT
ncbi:hypothetical protein [Sulfurimonas sp.]|uniref:hypothetical protein n=1 Tax=Sulfurimonas sp. TaxID=2022749 RepID=UPI0025DFA495|nr:hypothetical protein [Sulfurimonas sp.]